ncbi:MAG: alpha/beta hydrolase [Nitrospira sp.]|nr:alpha/beta hydrolase [Nitrospira sp.]
MAGNEVVRLVASLGHKFLPDIPALFEVYLRMHEHILPVREKYYKTKDIYVLFSGGGYLAAAWQLCWTLSRAGLRSVLEGLTAALGSPDVNERLAAVQCFEDSARYASVVHPPEFGGGSGPPEALPLASKQETDTRTSQKPVEISEYETLHVFYGTDRKWSGEDQPEMYYTGERGEELQVGVCKISIPKKPTHEIGEMERPAWWKLEFREDPNRHIVLASVQAQPMNQFSNGLRRTIDQSKEKQALLFVHGYRVTFADAARQTAQLAYDLDIEIPILYSWPSEGKFFSYGADRGNVENAVPFLKRFLATIAEESGAKTIHLIAHSMGNEALTRAIRELPQGPATPDGLLFKQIVLTAPDIDAGIFKNQILPQFRGKADRVTLYASNKDKALWAAKLLRRGYQRAGDTRGGKIVVAEGIDTIDASTVDTSFMGHSYFGDSGTVISDLYYLLRHGLAPDKRHGMLRKMHSDGPYWAFRPVRR